MEKLTLEQLDPSNLNKLTDEQIGQLKDLSNDEIKAAAQKYPNKPSQNNYLVLEDTRKGAKQLHNLSSWQNLADLRGPLNQQFWRVLSVKGKFFPVKAAVQAPTQDLTAKDINAAEGLKQTASTQNLLSIPGDKLDEKKDAVNENADGKGTADTNIEGNGTEDINAAEGNENLNLDEKELQELAKQNAAKNTTGTGTGAAAKKTTGK